MSKEYDYEEDFWKNERKELRKDRRIAQKTDRSKYKKTNQAASKVPRPVAGDTKQGRVISISGEGILVHFSGKNYSCSLKGALKKDRSRKKNLLVVGDFVDFLPLNETEGQIVQVQERSSLLERIDISGRKRQLLAANIDTVFITGSVVLPPLKPFLIDRYVIAAKKGNMEPVVLINKIDLLSSSPEEAALFEEFLSAYKNLTIIPVSCKTGKGIDTVQSLMKKKTSVFSGQSGVGKSSLINKILGLNLPIGEIVYKGKHTTTKAHLIPIGATGFCIDTPGIRSFGLWDLSKQDVLARFAEIRELGLSCKFQNCLHVQEPGCAVKQALEEKTLSPLIYESYTKLLEECDQGRYYT